MRTILLTNKTPYTYTSFTYGESFAVVEVNGPTQERTTMKQPRGQTVYLVLDSVTNELVCPTEYTTADSAARAAVAYTRHTGRAAQCKVFHSTSMVDTQLVNVH